ncbi:hypothetical protein [Priestia megaterium]|uniref:hypothetical protein n=1 Tax=Priestia megaterium TaxID=1404 RepID=UPI002877E535|nr:hypothetical protein [Priestia megaterium]
MSNIFASALNKQLTDKLGNLEGLQTSAKNSLVNSINENAGLIGGLQTSLGAKTSALLGYTYTDVTSWLNDVERMVMNNTINVMNKKYMAAGSLSVYAGAIVNNTNILTLTSSSHDFKVGHGIAVRTSDGTKEVETLKINSGATSSGNITLKLDGVTLIITVAAGDTPIQVADKIRNVAVNGNGGTVTQTLTGSGWNVDTNAVGSTDTVTFNHTNQGTKTLATLNVGSTGVNATVTATTVGTNVSEFISKVVEVNGAQLTLRDTYTGSNLAGKRIEHDDDEAINAAITDASTNFGTGTGIGGVVFLPAYRFPVRQIKMKSRVMLRGTGYGSRLWQRGNTNKDIITLNTINEEMCFIKDLSIDGQKPSQSAGRGIRIDNTGGSGFSFYDPIHVIENVLIMNTKGDGVTISGTREARVGNVFVFQADGHGFQLTPTDCFFTSCTSAGAGLNGFNLNAPNSRIATCKAYGSGRLEGSAYGDGFYISGSRHILVNCESQDNGRHGFMIYGGANNRIEGALADSNGNKTTGNGCGFNVAGGAMFNEVSGTAVNRLNYEYQKYALSIGSDSPTNSVSIKAPSGANANLNGEIYPNQGANNTIVINNQLGVQAATYSATFTPAVYDGGKIIMTLTGNITIANTVAGKFHTGAEMILVLKQDATGGRTVTFGNQYKTTWTPDTSANKTNILKLMFDGTNWIQTSSTVGI